MRRIRINRVVAGACLVALVAAGCSSGSDTATSDVKPVVDEPVAEALGVSTDDDEFGEPERPELLKSARNALSESVAAEPGEAPFEIPFLDEAVASTSVESEDAGAAALSIAPEAAGSQTPSAPSSEAAPGSVAEGVGAEELTGTSGGSEASESIAASFPLPGPPAGGEIPSYDDPSDQLVAASGRPFDATVRSDKPRDRGVTKTSINVAGLVSETLATLPYRSQGCLGAQARFEQANHHGELSRSLAFDDCFDDEGQAEEATAESQFLAESEIFAAAPVNTPALTSADAFTQAGLPYVGTDALPVYCGRATSLGFNPFGALGCPVLEARGFSLLSHPVLTAYIEASNADPDQMVYLVADSAAGQSTAAARRFEAELLELDPLEVLAVLPPVSSAEPTSWTPVIDTVIDANAETVFVEGVVSLSLPRALRKGGFRGEIVLVGQFDPLLIANVKGRKGIGSATIVSTGIDVADRSTPGWRAIESAAAAVGLSADEIGLDFVHGYLAADFLVQAIASTPEPLTPGAFANTINQGWWYPGVAGVLCGSWWPAGHLVASPCVSVARIDVSHDAMVPVLGLVSTRPQLRFELQ